MRKRGIVGSHRSIPGRGAIVPPCTPYRRRIVARQRDGLGLGQRGGRHARDETDRFRLHHTHHHRRNKWLWISERVPTSICHRQSNQTHDVSSHHHHHKSGADNDPAGLETVPRCIKDGNCPYLPALVVETPPRPATNRRGRCLGEVPADGGLGSMVITASGASAAGTWMSILAVRRLSLLAVYGPASNLVLLADGWWYLRVSAYHSSTV